MKDIGNLMKQAQQMQAQMKKMQEEIQQLEVVGESGAGLVKVTMTGRHDVKQVAIDPELKQEELEVLQDLIAAAVNDAVRKVEAVNKEKMGGLAGGMKMPPGFDFNL